MENPELHKAEGKTSLHQNAVYPPTEMETNNINRNYLCMGYVRYVFVYFI